MISAKIICDSVNPVGIRLTTFQLMYPRIIHCFDDRTEVLCQLDGRRTFRKWSEVVHNDRVLVAAYDASTRNIQFESPSHWISQYFEGNLVCADNQRLSFAVTDEHRMFVGSRKSGGDLWEIIKAKDLLGDHTQKRFETNGFVRDGEECNIDMARLLGFFVGDGHLPRHGHQAIFNLKKDRKIKYLHDLLVRLKIPFEVREWDKGVIRTTFQRFPELELCYHSDRKKQVPEFVTRFTPDAIKAFLEGLWFSDGSIGTGYCRTFNTSSPHVADALSALAAMAGMRINLVHCYGNDMFKLTSGIEKKPILRRDKCTVRLEPYAGYVYCATVSTGLLVVRRRGLVLVSGNCEIMTHRVLSRNASSSRAIPVEKMLQRIEENPAMPVYWGANQKGMQAQEEISDIEGAKAWWLESCRQAVAQARRGVELGLHKQIVNRITEPFQHMVTLVSSTDFANFFHLRYHPDAQPEFQELARQMWVEYHNEAPKVLHLKVGEWHLPYIKPEDRWDGGYPVHDEDLKKISVGRCARVSYVNQEGQRAPSEDIKLHDRLLGAAEDGPGHFSPFEHVSMALPDDRASGNFRGWFQYRKSFANENLTIMPKR